MDNQLNNTVTDKCYKTSNNKYFGCPPRMDDGRHFTDYRSNCYVNNLAKSNNKTYNSFQYRMFLTQNANKIMDLNRGLSCQKNCCGPCEKPYETGTMLPEKNVQTCNTGTCTVNRLNNRGLGLGRSYSEKSIKCGNWPSSLPLNQPNNCCSTPEDEFYQKPDDIDIGKKNTNRLTIPGGAMLGQNYQ